MTCPHGMPVAGSCVECMDEGLLPQAPKPERARPLGRMTIAGAAVLAVLAVLAVDSWLRRWRR